ncbi:hypothetical protein [Reinekea sp. G2M2-21]|uniref:hypothetical protein n=1 Tax=Reinekea sp. G2M2-21 TaxID=2788942 RepID=UPI0018AAB9E1|nr:hypothetical protein [Reinekea sp. G2M2-21]
MIFTETLTDYLQRHPITISASQFPVSVANIPENAEKLALFDTLTEEGWLQKTSTVADVGNKKVLFTRVFNYELNRSRQDQPIIVGYVQLEHVIYLELLTSNDSEDTRYRVGFTWLYHQPSPWIWAPALSANPELTFIKSALKVPQTADIHLVWEADQKRWSLQQWPTFLNAE